MVPFYLALREKITFLNSQLRKTSFEILIDPTKAKRDKPFIHQIPISGTQFNNSLMIPISGTRSWVWTQTQEIFLGLNWHQTLKFHYSDKKNEHFGFFNKIFITNPTKIRIFHNLFKSIPFDYKIPCCNGVPYLVDSE